jgi:hypothetical protein
MTSLLGPAPALASLNQPGTYLHWGIILVSEANLSLIVAMVIIFGLALLLPFPHGRQDRESASAEPALETVPPATRPPAPDPADPTSRMWTARVRRLGLALLPPAKLLPDRQPAYVASWVYLFGVATLAALAVAIVSGLAVALGGPDWWQTTSVGHFFNSLHLWSVELFMAFMVIHLWGKFWMAAWRGKRGLTWITGVVAFLASIVECFTGYLSQQNFDSQWIATSGKDAINATGLGAYFNLMNFGQMLLWHVVLLPLVLVSLAALHVLLVRVRGVSHPLPEQRQRTRIGRRETAVADATEWRGPTRRYDIVKEAAIATLIALGLTIVLAAVLSSPDVPPTTIRSWAKVAPADFLATAASELAGTSETATYGPPYNDGTGSLQSLGISWEQLVGVREPINAASSFVLSPLAREAPTDPTLARALADYRGATAAARARWDGAYLRAVTKVRFQNGAPFLPLTARAAGPVPTLLSSELTLARSGALDADLIAQQPFYGTDFTKPLLFLEDGEYFASQASALHLAGTQWGVMNETGSYPGQPWLWLYTLWYQIPAFGNSPNADLIAIYLTGVATMLLLAIPFLPGLRDIPRWVPVHRLIWRNWYRDQELPTPGTGSASPAHPTDRK